MPEANVRFEGEDTPAPSGDILSSILADMGLGTELAALDPAYAGEGSLTEDIASQQPKTLSEMLVATNFSMVGRKAITGEDFTGALPPWVKKLPMETLISPDFDPYFGVVSEGGDEKVFMGGTRMYKTAESFDLPPSGDFGDDEFRSGGNQSPTKTVTKEEGDKVMSLTAVKNLPYTWEQEEITEAIETMNDAGLPVKGFDDMVSAWGSLVDRASMVYGMSEGERKVTPWDVLDMYKSEAKAAGVLPFSGKKTTTSRSVSTLSEGEAWSTLQSTLSQMLGRDPSDQEIRDYTYKMNQLAAANPSITKTITKYKNGEAVSQSSHTDAGLGAQDAAMEAYYRAQANPEYAEYQASTEYFNAAVSALGAIGQT